MVEMTNDAKVNNVKQLSRKKQEKANVVIVDDDENVSTHNIGRDYFTGLKVTKRNKATVLIY